ncbi:hypothetical protein [Streptomyces sp. NPDC058678]|uniref:hypothetical protein n=1 Tax=Streptomyces sp. NPDC058678 TaxID=3346595 RepID=UPI00366832D5
MADDAVAGRVGLPIETGTEAASFAGRRWIWPLIQRWYDSDGAVLFICGQPGVGKSALARHWASFNRDREGEPGPPRLSAAHFCDSTDDASLDPTSFVLRLSDQLRDSVSGFADAQAAHLAQAAFHESRMSLFGNAYAGHNAGLSVGVYIERLSLVGRDFDAGACRQLVQDLVVRPLSNLSLRAQPVVLVDALDESRHLGPGLNIENLVLRGPLRGGPLRLVVTSRDSPRDLRANDALINFSDHLAEGMADVEQYLRTRAPRLVDGATATDVQSIAHASNGNFLYARHAAAGGSGDGLTDLYRRMLETLRRSGPSSGTERWRHEIRPVLAALAVAREEGLDTDQLATITGLDQSAVLDVLEDLGSFVTGTGRHRPWKIYHWSFSDFLTTSDEAPILAGEAHARVARALAEEWHGAWGECVNRYARTHTAFHFRASIDALRPETSLGRGVVKEFSDFVSDSSLLLSASRQQIQDLLLRHAADLTLKPLASESVMVLRRSFHQLSDTDLAPRASLLRLVALQSECTDVADGLLAAAQLSSWWPRWSKWQVEPEHAVVAAVDGDVIGPPRFCSIAGSEALVVPRRHRIAIVDVGSNGALQWALDLPDVAVTAIDLFQSGGDTLIAVGADEGTVQVWNLVTRSRIASCREAGDGQVNAVQFVANDTGAPLLVVGAEGARGYVNIATGTAHVGRPTGSAGTLQVWRIGPTCRLEYELLPGHEESVSALYCALHGDDVAVVAVVDMSFLGDESESNPLMRMESTRSVLYWSRPSVDAERVSVDDDISNRDYVGMSMLEGRPHLLSEFDSADLSARRLSWHDLLVSSDTVLFEYPEPGSVLDGALTALDRDERLCVHLQHGCATVYSLSDRKIVATLERMPKSVSYLGIHQYPNVLLLASVDSEQVRLWFVPQTEEVGGTDEGPQPPVDLRHTSWIGGTQLLGCSGNDVLVIDTDTGEDQVVISWDSPVWAAAADLAGSGGFAIVDSTRNIAIVDPSGETVACRDSGLRWPEQNAIALLLKGDRLLMVYGGADREVHLVIWSASGDEGADEYLDDTLMTQTAAVMELQLLDSHRGLWMAMTMADGRLDVIRVVEGRFEQPFSKEQTSTFFEPRPHSVRLHELDTEVWVTFRLEGSTVRVLRLTGGDDAAEIDTGVAGATLDMLLVEGRPWILLGVGHTLVVWDSSSGVRLRIDCGGEVRHAFWSGRHILVVASRGFIGLVVRWSAHREES